MIRRALHDASAVAIGAPLGVIIAVIMTAAEKFLSVRNRGRNND